MDVLYKHRVKERYTVAIQTFTSTPGNRYNNGQLLVFDNLTIQFGVAHCHPSDSFNRAIGRNIARLKMEDCPVVVDKVELYRDGSEVLVCLVGYYEEVYKVVLHYGPQQEMPYLGAVERIK